MNGLTASDQAKLPHNATFVDLGRKVWFMLEHSFRARGKGDELDRRLLQLKEQQDDVAGFNLSWMRVGSFDQRRVWNSDEWIAFLRTWQSNAANAFLQEATNEEENLAKCYTIYWLFYANLPNIPELPDNAPQGYDMAKAQEQCERFLEEFECRLGDPLLQCNHCKACALGKKMLRCSRCKSEYYCDVEHQKKDWKRHKKVCHQTD